MVADSDLSEISAVPPPPGHVSNFINPPSLAPWYRGIIFSFVPLMLVFLVLRLYTRLRIVRKWGWDDGNYVHLPGQFCIAC